MTTVWIIGAGFSRALGGPLLPDLFSEDSVRDVISRFDLLIDTDHLLSAADIYRPRKAAINTGNSIGGTTYNAESFLAEIDKAVSRGRDSADAKKMTMSLKSHAFRIFGDGDYDSLKRLAFATRRLLAAECSSFTKDADLSSETWGPFIRWGEILREEPDSNCVLTFNYDRVLESINEHLHNQVFRVVRPLEHRDVARQAVPVYKLHGSVDWVRRKGNAEVVYGEEYAAVFANPDDEILMAIPGPSKKAMVTACFDKTWAWAFDEVRSASKIVFVGYRIPESDPLALNRIVSAIRKNENQSLSVSIVLGADKSSRDATRLESLLQFAIYGRKVGTDRNFKAPSRVIHQTGLYSQDALELWGHLGAGFFDEGLRR